MKSTTKIKQVCFFGTYMKHHTINRVLLQGFKKNGIHVVECHEELWEAVPADYKSLLSPFSILKLLFKTFRAYIKVVSKFLKYGKKNELILISHPVYLDILPAWIISKLSRTPLYVYFMISIYDTFINDRKIFSQKSLWAYFFRLIDKITCKLADRVIVDTELNAEFLRKFFRITPPRIIVSYCSTDYDTIEKIKRAPKKTEGTLLVIYHGYFIPLHGVRHIMECAHLLRENNSFHFLLIGDGQELEKCLQFAKRNSLKNVSFKERLPFEILIKELTKGDILLGIFGKGDKTQRVIPFKVFTALALNKPLITAWTPALERAGFKNYFHLIGIPWGDPESLKDALLFLKDNPQKRKEIAENGHKIFENKFLPAKVIKPIIDS